MSHRYHRLTQPLIRERRGPSGFRPRRGTRRRRIYEPRALAEDVAFAMITKSLLTLLAKEPLSNLPGSRNCSPASDHYGIRATDHVPSYRARPGAGGARGGSAFRGTSRTVLQHAKT